MKIWHMLIDHIISEISNLMIRKVILISDITTLLDYGHQFIGSLHVVDSKSRIHISFCCYLRKVQECSWFSFVEC